MDAGSLAAFFASRCPPEHRPALSRLANEVAESHSHEPPAARRARLLSRARALLAPSGMPYAPDPLVGPVPRLEAEWRRDLARRLEGIAPDDILETAAASQWTDSLEESTVLDWWGRWLKARREGRVPELLQFYAHLPFCRTRCAFCQCASLVVGADDDVDRSVELLEAQARRFHEALGALPATVATIGGGTPSLLSAPQLERVFAALVGRVFTLAPDGYFSVEFNPDSTSDEKLAVLARHGVTRLSIGVQSLHQPVLDAVARGYQTRDAVFEALALARRYSFQLSVDLLAPLPEETPETFREGVRDLLAEAPDQVVVYGYKPVWRAGRPFASGAALTWPEAEAIAQEEGFRAGYSRVPHTGASAVLEKPGCRQFAVRYVQHPMGLASTLALGPFAESHVFGRGRYVADRTSDGELSYRGVKTDVEEEQRNLLSRRFSVGKPVSPTELLRDCGADLPALWPEATALLSETGQLVSTEEGWLPAPTDQARHAAAWQFVDARRLTKLSLWSQRRTRRRGVGPDTGSLVDTCRLAAALVDASPEQTDEQVRTLDDPQAPLGETWLELLTNEGAGWTWAVAGALSLEGLAWEERERQVAQRLRALLACAGGDFNHSLPALIARLEAAGAVERIVVRSGGRQRARRVELDVSFEAHSGVTAAVFGGEGPLDRLSLVTTPQGSTTRLERRAEDGVFSVRVPGRGVVGVRSLLVEPPVALAPALALKLERLGTKAVVREQFESPTGARAMRWLVPPASRKRSLPVAG